MELPQPRPFGTEGKKPTRDFLPLYSHSSFQHQDPRPSQGIHLITHDFLQPLERIGKNSGKGEKTVEKATIEKRSPPSSSSGERVLPGGIGTYSIGHIPTYNQQVPKAERNVCAVVQASSAERNNEIKKANSNCNSYGGGVFTLWEESAVKKGTAVKASPAERQVIKVSTEKLGQWSSEWPIQAPFIHRNSFSPLSSSKQSAQKNQSFMEMMKSGKGLHEDEDDDEEEFLVKKDGSSQKELTVKVDGKNTDQRANTPRSKHSATEQRRRSKINDRFQILRDLIPQNDQKRDKASFLLEVIEYIQFLQEKVNKYDASYQGWNQEPMKLTPWRNGHGPGENIVDHSRAIKNGPGPVLMFSGNDNNIAVAPTMLANTQTPVESNLSTSTTYKTMDHNPGLSNKAVPMPIPLQPNMFNPVGRSGALAQPLQRPISDAENMTSQPQSQLWQSRPCATECPITDDAMNEQELTMEGGTISISAVYSQGLLNNLTQALQSSGVDLSQASISVQVDLGKRALSRLTTTTSTAKDYEDPSRIGSSGEDSDQAQKRLKTEKN